MPSDETKNVLSAAYGKIQSLMADGRWLEAHRGCLEVLQFDPDNIRVIRLKNKIESRVKQTNREAIKEDLKNIQALWNEGKYEEYLSHLKELEPYIVDYPALKDVIVKAQNAYQQSVRGKQEVYYQNEIAAIKKMMERQEFQEALRAAEKLRILNIREKDLKTFIARIRTEWIETELKKGKALFETQKYEDILLFYQGLLRIDGKSQKLKKLIETTKEKYLVFRIGEKRDVIYKGLEKMRTLYQLQKFQRTMEAATEIMSIDPKNREAKSYYAKAKRKVARDTGKELITQMKSANKQMREQFQKNRKDFVKI